jgi:hypothetical protein
MSNGDKQQQHDDICPAQIRPVKGNSVSHAPLLVQRAIVIAKHLLFSQCPYLVRDTCVSCTASGFEQRDRMVFRVDMFKCQEELVQMCYRVANACVLMQTVGYSADPEGLAHVSRMHCGAVRSAVNRLADHYMPILVDCNICTADELQRDTEDYALKNLADVRPETAGRVSRYVASGLLDPALCLPDESAIVVTALSNVYDLINGMAGRLVENATAIHELPIGLALSCTVARETQWRDAVSVLRATLAMIRNVNAWKGAGDGRECVKERLDAALAIVQAVMDLVKATEGWIAKFLGQEQIDQIGTFLTTSPLQQAACAGILTREFEEWVRRVASWVQKREALMALVNCMLRRVTALGNGVKQQQHQQQEEDADCIPMLSPPEDDSASIDSDQLSFDRSGSRPPSPDPAVAAASTADDDVAVVIRPKRYARLLPEALFGESSDSGRQRLQKKRKREDQGRQTGHEAFDEWISQQEAAKRAKRQRRQGRAAPTPQRHLPPFGW